MTTFNNIYYNLNGVIDTTQSTWSNIDNICNAARCWFTFDVSEGKWAVIINQAGNSVATFNDSNIIGGINITGTGIYELYNSAKYSFPNTLISDQKDYVVLDIPNNQRFQNEVDNSIELSSELVSDQIQAQAIASRELKQSRVDKIIEFRTDYSYIGLKAGDVISITNSPLGYTNKQFRIISIQEEDADDGMLNISITALEYDANVYVPLDIAFALRAKANGTRPTVNPAVDTSNDQSTGSQLLRLLGATMATNLLTSAFTKNPLTGAITQILSPKSATLEQNLISTFSDAARANLLKNLKSPPLTLSSPATVCSGPIPISITSNCNVCIVDTASIQYPYIITGVTASDITPVPLTGNVTIGQTLSIPLSFTGKTLTFTADGKTTSTTVNTPLTFTYVTTASPTSIVEGNSSTVTLTTTGVANGTIVPYTITGAGTGKLTTPLTGNVTVNSNTATLAIATTSDGTYTNLNTSVTVTFNPSQTDPCGQLDKTASVGITDSSTAPPAPPPDVTREYVLTPIVWVGVYDGTTGNLKSVNVQRSAFMPLPFPGEPTVAVPLTLTVATGNPATVTVATTRLISTVATLGGTDLQPIISFNSVPANGSLTGTRTLVYGYY